MRRRITASLLAAVAALLGASQSASASHCGAASYGCCPQPVSDAQCCHPTQCKQQRTTRASDALVHQHVGDFRKRIRFGQRADEATVGIADRDRHHPRRLVDGATDHHLLEIGRAHV